MYAAIYCLTLNEENISRNQNKPIKNSEMLDKYILFICSCVCCSSLQALDVEPTKNDVDPTPLRSIKADLSLI